MKNRAFTLAETLIVIGIIGVVAALTLPNLNHATGDKETVTKYKKLYSGLTDAFDRAVVIYGPVDEWFKNAETTQEKSKIFGERIAEFMKISKTCGFSKGCFSENKIRDIYGSEEAFIDYGNSNYAYSYQLVGGVALAFYGGIHQESRGKLSIDVDLDGPNKGKNQKGLDRFIFEIDSKDNLVPFIYTNEQLTGNLCTSYDTGMWILTNDNIDYLKCFSDLNWETQTSCK